MGPRAPRLRSEGEPVELHGAPEADDEFLREASEDLSNHQVEAIELELDHVLSVFSGL
jgi:hypothetical protein